MIKLILADDHQMFIDGLKSLLKNEKEIQVVGVALNGKDVLSFLAGEKADIVLMDINMPGMDGIETTRIVRQQFPEINIIILTMHNQPEFITALIREGASGYILKNTGRAELVEAIKSVYAGKTFFSEAVKETIMKNLQDKNGEQKPLPELLTKREKEILVLITQEFSTKQIADKLSIGFNTVETHRKNIMAKLQAKNVAGLVKYALQTGLL